MDRLIQQALENKGFSLVEILSQCPTYEGKWNKRGDAATMMKFYKDNAIPITSKSKYTEEQLQDKFMIGILHNQPKPEFTEEYHKIIDKYQRKEQMSELTAQKGKNESEGKKSTQE